MSEGTVAIIIAIIGFVGTVISVVVTSRNVRDGVMNTINIKMATIETRMDEMDKKITEHNGYAKLFQENIPLIKYRLEQIEKNEDK